MPIHIHPYFRSLEKNVLENSGIYKSINSLGYSTQLAEEVAGTKPTPPADLFKFVIYEGSNTELTLP